MIMQVQTSLRLHFNSPEDAKIFYRAFMPEFNTLPMKRSKWNVQPPSENTSDITFEINSEDGTAFRATVNSLIQFANVVDISIGLIAGKSNLDNEVVP